MYDPTMRVLTVLEMLQAHERVTGAQLASRLEVHPRTVQRYVARLQDLGVPVTASRGPHGAYRLRPGFRLPPLMFSGDEALALLLGLRALNQLGLSAFAPATEGAAAKLGRVLPQLLAARVRQIQDGLELDTPWMAQASAPLVMTLAAATQARRVVRFSYTSRSGEITLREAEPYAALRDEGRWYLIGLCRLRQSLRCFRADRIDDVDVLQDTFEVPEGFDARAALHWALAASPAQFEVQVWLALEVEAVRRGLPLLRPQLSGWVHPELGQGTLLHCGTDNLLTFAAMLLGLDCAVIVQEPDELRSTFAMLAGRASEMAQVPPSIT